MRNSDKSFEITKSVTQDILAATEEITQITERKSQGFVEVIVQFKDNSSAVIGEETYIISGDNYVSLMSANPSFAPGKPQNEYREADLWHMIDLIRSSSNT